MLRAEIRKISEFFYLKIFFLVVKFSIYLNRHVFVMSSLNLSQIRAFASELYTFVQQIFYHRIYNRNVVWFQRLHLSSNFHKVPAKQDRH